MDGGFFRVGNFVDFGDEVGAGDVDESAGGDGNYKRRESVYRADEQ